MDYDCLISKDVDVDSVRSASSTVAINHVDKETENIMRPRDVRIIPLGKFVAQKQKGQ